MDVAFAIAFLISIPASIVYLVLVFGGYLGKDDLVKNEAESLK